jgi:hypothetical protein
VRVAEAGAAGAVVVDKAADKAVGKAGAPAGRSPEEDPAARHVAGRCIFLVAAEVRRSLVEEGANTFGKGLVQTVFPLQENTGLALTTARYYTPSGRLIQRDYSKKSFFDYYVNRYKNSLNPADVKMTEGGRTVYGGGGITPDVKITAVKSNHFQDSLLQHYAFFNFAKHYIVDHQPAKNFVVDESVMQDFRKFLDSQNVPYTPADFTENLAWLRPWSRTPPSPGSPFAIPTGV